MASPFIEPNLTRPDPIRYASRTKECGIWVSILETRLFIGPPLQRSPIRSIVQKTHPLNGSYPSLIFLLSSPFSLLSPLFLLPSSPPTLHPSPLKPLSLSTPIPRSKSNAFEAEFSDGENPEGLEFSPPEAAIDFLGWQEIDVPPFESEEEIAKAYEELYGPAFSGESFLGNDVYEMDSEFKDPSDLWDSETVEQPRDGFEERLVQVRRVTKVVKGGKQLRFRAVVVVGDKKGRVGVGHGKAAEVVVAARKAGKDARRNLITVPMTKYLTFPHRAEADYGAARVMLRPAAPGTGVIAGGSVRVVLELAGVENALGKQLGSNNALNNARATIAAVSQMRQFREVALERGIPMEELWR